MNCFIPQFTSQFKTPAANQVEMPRSDHAFDLGSFGEVFTPNEAVTTSGDAASTFNFSNMTHAADGHASTQDSGRTSDRPVLAGLNDRPTFTRGSLLNRDIEAAKIENGVENPSDYKGRYRVSGFIFTSSKEPKN